MNKLARRASLLPSVPGAFAVLGIVSALAGCQAGNDASSDCPIKVVTIMPVSGKVGDPVTITGENLGGTAAFVGFSGATATPLAGSSETMLLVDVPLGAQTAPITVDVPSRQNCQGMSDATFTVTP